MFLLCFLVSAAASCSAQQPQSVELAFTGDMLMHYAVKGCALVHSNAGDKYSVEGFTYLFEKVSPELSSADFAIGNMEFPVSPPFIQNEFIFNCPPEVVPSLKKSGFYAVTVGNNHLLDQGLKGVTDTFGFLEQAGLNYFGAARTEDAARKGLLIEKNGIKIGILNYTGLLNYPFPAPNKNFYLNNLNQTDKVIADIQAMRKRCDFLIIQPHAGVEYTQEPTAEQRTLYRRLLDAGADMIIGHHPHTIQYAEGVKTSDGRDCTIFYSLGNFICNQNYAYPIPGRKDKLDVRDTAIIRLRVTKDGSKIASTAAVVPAFTWHEMRKNKNREYKDIQTIVISREMERLREEEKTAPEAKKSSIRATIDMFEKKRATIQAAIFRKGPVKNVEFR